MNNKIIGDTYEQYILNHLNKSSISYLWKYIPEEHLLKSNLVSDLNKHRLNRKKFFNNPKEYKNPLADFGIDILQIMNNGEYHLVQCKCGYKNGVRMYHLAGFYMTMSNHIDKKGSVYYTSKLSTQIRENNNGGRIEYIKKIHYKIVDNNLSKKIVLYDYQVEALDSVNKWFMTHNRGILYMPCGTVS